MLFGVYLSKLNRVELMENCLTIAEKLYLSFYDKRKFSAVSTEWLNSLVKEIKKEIVGTDLEIVFSNIYFKQGFKNDVNDNLSKLDISLIPNYECEYEFILWLACFIEKITISSKHTPPPIKAYIPDEYTYSYKLNKNFKSHS